VAVEGPGFSPAKHEDNENGFSRGEPGLKPGFQTPAFGHG